jgi:uncharacterized protein with HEPN domain
MSEERLAVYLGRMTTAAARAVGYVKDLPLASFKTDQRTQDAVVANIAALGECVTKIMDSFPDFVVEHPELPWRDIRAMSNRIAHQYFEVDVDTVWRTVTIDVPQVLRLLDGVGSPSRQ